MSDAGDSAARRPRRAQRPAPEGVDPHPSDHALTSRAGEDKPEAWGEASKKRAKPSGASGENDDRLQQDKPPHWG